MSKEEGCSGIIIVGVRFKTLKLQYNRIANHKGASLMVTENKKVTKRAKEAGQRFLHRMETGFSA